MKKLFIAALTLISTTATFAQKKVNDVAKFDVETFDFGKVKQNVPAKATFTVTNITTEPIIIENAQPTCGCTIGDFTKSPIAPGKSGTITATYNAASLGSIHKSITVKLNGIDEVKSLGLAGEVLDDKAYAKWESGNKQKQTAIDSKADVKVKTDKNTAAVKKTKKVAVKKS